MNKEQLLQEIAHSLSEKEAEIFKHFLDKEFAPDEAFIVENIYDLIDAGRYFKLSTESGKVFGFFRFKDIIL